MDYKDHTVYVSSREPETLIESIDMTYSPKGFRQSGSPRSRASSPRRGYDSIALQTLSKSDPQVLVHASRKGTHLNDPQAFTKRVAVTRQTIDNVPILPKLGCSDQTFVGRMQDNMAGGMYRMGNRILTDALVFNSHHESSDPFDRKNGDRERRQSADRSTNKPMLQEGAIRKSNELERTPLVEPYKYTVFNIETKCSRINFRHDTKKKVTKKKSTDIDNWERYGGSTEKYNSIMNNEESIVCMSQPSFYEKQSAGFQDYLDPCLHHAAEGSHESVQQFSTMLVQMDDTSSSDSVASENDSVEGNQDDLPLVKHTEPHTFNVADDDKQVPFPKPPAAAHEQVEDGTMTSFINWNPRPMYLAAQPMYVQPVFYPIDEKRFGSQQFPLATMIEASLKEFSNSSKPTTPIYFAPKPAEMLPLPSKGKPNLKISTPRVVYSIEKKAKSKTSTPVCSTPVHQPGSIHVLSAVRNIDDTTEEDRSKPQSKKGFFQRLFGCGKNNHKEPVAEIPRQESTTLTVSPKGSKDRSELRKAKQTSSLVLSTEKKKQPKKAPKRKGSGCMKKNSEEFDEELELPAKVSSPSVVVLDIPKDRSILVVKPSTKSVLPKKKRSAMKLRRLKAGPYKKPAIRRTTRRAEPRESEVELASPSQAVYVLREPQHNGLSPVSSEQQMKCRESSTEKPRKQTSTLKMCAGKQRNDDTAQTAGDPPYGLMNC